MVDTADARGIPLTVFDVSEPEIRELYGCDLALIRPDQHIAWRGNAEPTDPTSLLGQLTGH